MRVGTNKIQQVPKCATHSQKEELLEAGEEHSSRPKRAAPRQAYHQSLVTSVSIFGSSARKKEAK